MRTTLAIEDSLLKIAKRRARVKGLTLGQYVEEALRRDLARDQTTAPRPPVPVMRGGSGMRPGIDPTSNRSMQEALDEGLPLDKLR